MNKIYTSLLFIVASLFSYAQDAEILGVWYLDYIIKDGIQYQSTIPVNNYHIEFTNQQGNDFGLLLSGSVCYSYIASYTTNSSNEIEIDDIYNLAEGCSIEIEEDFYSQYISIIGNPTTYAISGSGSNASLIITTQDGNTAHYNRGNFAPVELVGQWYLYSTTINNVQQDVPLNSLFDLVVTYTNADTGLEFYGNAICNGYFGEYNYLGNSGLEITVFGTTLVECDNQEEADYEDNYFYNIFHDEPITQLTYSISGEGNSALLQINNQNGNYASYGRLSLSTTEFSSLDISIFPNPTHNLIYINGLQYLDQYSYTILDIHGKIIEKRKMYSEEISVSVLTSGVYFLQLKDNQSKTMKVLKFVKL